MFEHEPLMENLNRNYADFGLDKWRILPLPVYKKYKEYIATGEYPYISAVTKYIMGSLPALSPQQEENLGTLVYNAAETYRAEQREARKQTLLAEGWKPLTEEVCKTTAGRKGKLLVLRETTGILGSGTKEEIYKLVIGSTGDCFFMTPRARNKGVLWYHFTENGFYKELIWK